MAYRILVEATVVTHFAFLAYVVGGGLLAWKWRWAIWPHLAAAGWGFAVTVLHLDCPLTYLENWARARAGEPGLVGGFIDHYVTGVVYPARYTGLIQVLVGIVVAVSWAGVARLRWRTGQEIGQGIGQEVGQEVGQGVRVDRSADPARPPR